MKILRRHRAGVVPGMDLQAFFLTRQHKRYHEHEP